MQRSCVHQENFWTIPVEMVLSGAFSYWFRLLCARIKHWGTVAGLKLPSSLPRLVACHFNHLGSVQMRLDELRWDDRVIRMLRLCCWQNGSFTALPSISLWICSVASVVADHLQSWNILSTTLARKLFTFLGKLHFTLAFDVYCWTSWSKCTSCV